MAKECKHVKAFREKHLKPSETIIATGEGYIGEMMGSGDKTQHNGALIVTNEKAYFYRKGFFGEVLENIPLKSITSIERKSTLGHYTVSLHTSHDDLTFKCMQEKEIVQALVDAIEDGRSSTSSQPNVPPFPSESAIDKLKKLGELKDAGVLTEEEFQQQKAKLLAEI
ncbi:TPA: PH domain-containing protein [Vibrio parahaemolyticus]|uniref:PH domain-containing protein n=1 Tax=Vibrio TaxID=662 RepID=UPI00045F4589|nr:MULTISPECIES: PH domain-containing protein [Vibrio harveyi group]EJG1637705.1 PH domain-containing protein [Vibrio alginolyticus]GAK14818.1 hypothetical protein JCM19053_4689 [Vibrio sp. JCM 19053]EJA7355648.1 PH domain-containing protein [Vibrio parahaemolyticus]KWU38740.1 hypothetical protein AVL52_02960 [Vibrio parahaemolyticus]MBE4233815.1 hypothetical protein [Vibrio parahaemolyticus]